MVASIQIGKRFIPLEHIALVEPFDPSTQPQLTSNRPFQARIVLIDRDSVLSENGAASFVISYNFLLLKDDGIAINPHIHHRVEEFEPDDVFKPTKNYASRISWRDQDRQIQSKLLLADNQSVLELVVTGRTDQRAPTKPALRRSAARGTRQQRQEHQKKTPIAR